MTTNPDPIDVPALLSLGLAVLLLVIVPVILAVAMLVYMIFACPC